MVVLNAPGEMPAAIDLTDKLAGLDAYQNSYFTVTLTVKAYVATGGENVAEGMGITEKLYRAILLAGVNVITMGNHTWGKKEIFNA